MHITPDNIKTMAAANVAAYKTSGAPLNDSITKIAMDNELNSDQVKRLVEATNQMAYLSKLEDQDDRTFEFDVANYDDIMDGIVSDPSLEKVASSKANPMDLVTSLTNTPMEKVASDKEASLEKWGTPEKLKALKKVAEHSRNRLIELDSMEHDYMVKLAQSKETIRRDPDALEKMASFDNQLEMTRLVYGHDKIASDVRRVWLPGELDDITSLSNNLEMIKQASSERESLRPKVEKADELLKEAFVASAIRSINGFRANQSRSAGMPKMSNGIKTIKPKAKKAYGAFEAVTSANEINQNAARNFDAWSSLRG